ncbi:MAG: hypothetical protein PHP62_05540 [Candidatus Moranbacteria bacterium]|nr:hypothetical protein [Candidatus Moranbacteria bacterium]
MNACMFVSVVEQGGRYFSIGEQGQSLSPSDEDAAVFGEKLNKVLCKILNFGRYGDQIEVYFTRDEEMVRFILRNSERQKIVIQKVSEIPPKGSEAWIFLDQFVEEIKE